MDQSQRLRGLLRRTAAAAVLPIVLLVVVLAGYTGYVAFRHSQPRDLPVQAGPYPVGRVRLEWTDRDRPDPLAPEPGGPRRLSVWLWYPAEPTGQLAAGYAPGAWSQLHFPAPIGWGETAFGAIRTHSTESSPVAAGRFPVVVLEPGLGFAVPQYAALAQSLAGHGYLVAGVTPTYSANLTVLAGHPVHASAAGNPAAFDAADLHAPAVTATADALLAVWAADARFAARQVAGLDAAGPFAGRVDGSRVVYAGHSFGGAAALEACRTDRACAGAVDLDGTEYGPVARLGLNRPTLLVASRASCITGSCRPRGPADVEDRDVAVRMIAAGRGPVERRAVAGAEHLDLSDYDAYYLAWPLRRLLGLGPADGRVTLRTVAAAVTGFADRVTASQPTRPVTRG